MSISRQFYKLFDTYTSINKKPTMTNERKRRITLQKIVSLLDKHCEYPSKGYTELYGVTFHDIRFVVNECFKIDPYSQNVKLKKNLLNFFGYARIYMSKYLGISLFFARCIKRKFGASLMDNNEWIKQVSVYSHYMYCIYKEDRTIELISTIQYVFLTENFWDCGICNNSCYKICIFKKSEYRICQKMDKYINEIQNNVLKM